MSRDRKDAKRVQLPGLMQCCIDLKPGRMENEVYINRKMDVTELVDFLEKKKAEGIKYTFFQALITAVGKVMYSRPKMNRFITNRHLYEHNEVLISFVAKMTLDDRSEELMLTVPIAPEDNMASIADKVAKTVENLRGENVEKKGANSAIDVLGNLPNILRIPIFGLVKLLDKFGWLPSELMKNNIYFSSIIVSNLGSIRCGAIYHNLANFGSCSSLASFGEIIAEKFLRPDGTEGVRKVCEFGITLDERIADGFYFAKSAQMVEYILRHPELLSERVDIPVVMN